MGLNFTESEDSTEVVAFVSPDKARFFTLSAEHFFGVEDIFIDVRNVSGLLCIITRCRWIVMFQFFNKFTIIWYLLQVIPQYGTVVVYASRITDTPGPDNHTLKVGPAGDLFSRTPDKWSGECFSIGHLCISNGKHSDFSTISTFMLIKLNSNTFRHKTPHLEIILYLAFFFLKGKDKRCNCSFQTFVLVGTFTRQLAVNYDGS